jgi:hypothetical protein
MSITFSSKSNTLKVLEEALSFLQWLPIEAIQFSKHENKTKKAIVMINVIVFIYVNGLHF